MKFISLFAGIGGFDLGFERAGMTCVAQVENNAHANQILARQFPHAERYEDVSHVGRHNLPAADVICGGFPCQDVSVAGRRAGLAGERSGLWFEFLRILTEVTPEWCVIENVPGLLSSSRGRDFAVVLRGLVECGYGVSYRILDAQYFGVAQRRRRVFIVGSLGSGRSAQVLFEREGCTGHLEPSSETGESPAASTGAGASVRSYNEQRSDQYADASVDATLASRDGKGVRTVVAEAIDVRNSRSNGDISGTLQSKANGGYSLNYQNPIAIKIDNTKSNGWGVLEDGTTHTLGGSTDVIAFQQNQREEVRDLGNRVGALAAEPGAHQQNYIAFMGGQGAKAGGIAASETTAPTLKAGGSGTNQVPAVAFNWHAGAQHGMALNEELSPTLQVADGTPPAGQQAAGVRRLTPRECERLQGFPDDWTAGLSDSARYQRLGNAVCVNVAEWLGKRIVAATP